MQFLPSLMEQGSKTTSNLSGSDEMFAQLLVWLSPPSYVHPSLFLHLQCLGDSRGISSKAGDPTWETAPRHRWVCPRELSAVSELIRACAHMPRIAGLWLRCPDDYPYYAE